MTWIAGFPSDKFAREWPTNGPQDDSIIMSTNQIKRACTRWSVSELAILASFCVYRYCDSALKWADARNTEED